MTSDEFERILAIIEGISRGEYSDAIMEYTKPGCDKDMRRLAEAVGMMMVQIEAREMRLRQLLEQLKENTVKTVEAMAEALGARDDYTKGHDQRVAAYAARLARRLDLPAELVDQVHMAGLLHDIGKIGFGDRIFANDDTAPTQGMLADIRRHPSIGAMILAPLDFLGPVREYVLCHHERLDGRGYPEARLGDDIPLGARILAVADVFDAVTTDRPYQKGRDRDSAFSILRMLAGEHLDAELVELFIEEVRRKGVEV